MANAVAIGDDFEPITSAPAAPAIGSDFTPIGNDFEPIDPQKKDESAIESGFHRVMNDVRSFGAAAGKYIFEGMEGISRAAAHELAGGSTEVPAYQFAKAGVMPADPAAEKQAKESADYWKQRAVTVDQESGVDPQLAQTADARISSAAGSAAVMAGEGLVPMAGLPIMAMHGALAAKASAIDAGKNESEADDAAVRSLIGLSIFGATNKVAALGVAKLLPEGASTLTKFVSQFAGQDAANEASSRAIGAWEAADQAKPGEKLAAATQALTNTNLETSTLNAVYAGMGAAHEAGAKPEPPMNIGKDFEPIGIESVRVPAESGQGTADSGQQEPTFMPSDITVPQGVAQQAAKSANDLRFEPETAPESSPVQTSAPEPAPVKFADDESIPFMVKARWVEELQKRGMSEDEINNMTVDQVSAASKAAAVENTFDAYRAAKPQFDAALQDAAGAIGGDAKIVDLKTRERTLEKAKLDYNGRIEKVRDVVRGAIVVDDPRALAIARERLAQTYRLTRTKNTFDRPNEAGYSAMYLNVDLGGGREGEVQLTTPAMWEAKKQARPFYREWRTLDPKSERARELAAKMQAIYAPAREASTNFVNSSKPISGSVMSLSGLESGRGGSKEQLSAVQPSDEGTSATGRPSTSKNLVPGGNDFTTPESSAAAAPEQARSTGWRERRAARLAADAEAEHRAEVMRQFRSAGSGSGRDVLEVVERAGGMPDKRSPHRAEWKGELEHLETFARNPQRTDRSIRPNKLFTKTAPSMHHVVESLQSAGFPVHRADDVFNLVEERLRNSRPMYGNPELTSSENFTGLRAAELPDIPASGALNAARERKAAAWKRVKDLRDRVRAAGPQAGNLRLDLLQAESTHRDAVRAESNAQAAIDRYRGEQGRIREAVTSYLDAESVPADKQEEAANGIARALSLSADPAMARPYAGVQAELFDTGGARVAAQPAPAARSLLARELEANRAGLAALKSGDVAALNAALASNRNRVSTIIHDLVAKKLPAWDIVGSVIATPADMAAAVQTIRSPYFESMKVAVLNRQNKVVASEIISVGTLNEAIVHPRDVVRVFARLKEKYKQARMVLSHNHPSGDPTPSGADISLQHRLEEAAKLAGVEMLDHVITNGRMYYSFKAIGVESLPAARTQPWEVVPTGDMPRLTGPEELAKFAATLRAGNPDAAHIIYTDTKYGVKAIERVPDITSAPVLFRKAIVNGVGREGAYAVIVDLPGRSLSDAIAHEDPQGDAQIRTMKRIQETLQVMGVKLLDATWPGMESANVAGLINETPKLRASQRQGDLLAGTEADPFNLRGEEGIDYGARAEAAARAETEAARARAEQDRQQTRLFEEPPSQTDFEKAANDKEKMRGHIATTQRMVDVSPDVKQRVESWYTPTTLPEVEAAANSRIDKLGLGKATDAFMTSRTSDVDTLALGHHVSLRLDSLGRYDEAAMVREKMAEKMTSPAQAMWFISTIAKTSPEGLIHEAQKIVTDQIRNDPEKMKLLGELERLKRELAQIQDEKQKAAATQVVIRQLAQVNKPGQRLTEKQLRDLLVRHEQGKLTEEDLAAALAKHLKIPRLTPDNVIKIKRAQQEWARATDPIVKMRRAADMMGTVYGLVPRSFWDKVRGAATISMILHGRLPVRIGVSNLLQMSGQTAVDAINAVTLDPMMSILTGQRTVKAPELKARLSGLAAPVEAFRAGYGDARAKELGVFKSFREGVRTLLDMATLTTRGIQEVNDMAGRPMHLFSSRFGQLAEDTVTLLHNVVPYAFWNAGFKASLARQMRAVRAEAPTAEMIANARLDANKAIFQNETAAYHMLRGIRRVLDYPTAKMTGGKYGIGTATVPFAKVPGAILTEGIHWTPLGFVRSGWETFRPLFTKEAFRQKEFVDAFTKAVVGTGALVATGYWLGKLGILTGAPDENKDVEAMRKSTGFGAFRVNVSELKRRFLTGNFHTPMRDSFGQNGDLTISYNWLEPVAFPIAMGADIARSHDKREIDLKKGKITSNAIVTSITAGVETITTHPMLMNIERFTQQEAQQGLGTAAAGAIANVPGNFVPSLARQTAQYIDNAVREGRGGSMIDQEVSRLAVQLPWLSQKYPARYDVFGDAVQRYNYANNSLVNVFFNPAQPNELRKNPNVDELMRLYQATGSATMPGQVDKKITINGRQVELDNEQLATYQRYVGRLSSAGIARLLASPAFAAEPNELKRSLIAQVLSAVHEAAKIDLFGQQVYSVGSRGSVQIASPYAFEEMNYGRAGGLNRPVLPQFP